VSLEEGLDGHVEGEVHGLGAREGQARDEGIDPALAAVELRPRRHLGPVELEDLAGRVAGALGGAHRARAQGGEAQAHQIDRARVAVVALEDLGRPWGLDLGPVGEQPDQDRLERLERVEHRTRAFAEMTCSRL